MNKNQSVRGTAEPRSILSRYEYRRKFVGDADSLWRLFISGLFLRVQMLSSIFADPASAV